MASFSLDDIKAAAEAKFGSTDIDISETETVRLLNPLRLSKEKRDSLTALTKSMSEDDADQEAILSEAIELVAESAGAAEKLLGAVGSDLAVLVQIFTTYSEGTQVGEASGSQD